MQAAMNLDVLNQVFILTALMAVGVLLHKCKIITNELVRGLSLLLVNVAVPCTILSSFHFALTQTLMASALAVFGISAAIHVVLIGLAQLCFYRLPKGRRQVFIFATVFSNCGFVGFPLAQGLFGDIGVFYASIFSIPFNFLIFSYGVHLFGGLDESQSLWRKVANPPLIATMIGLVFFVATIRLPSPIAKTIINLGNMTTPLSMLIIGAMLAETKITAVFTDPQFYYLSLLKLIVAPLLVVVALAPFALDHTAAYTCIALVAMPSASLVGVFAQRYNGDTITAARCAFVTTVLSVITVPALLALHLRPL
jgi:predicted permease